MAVPPHFPAPDARRDDGPYRAPGPADAHVDEEGAPPRVGADDVEWIPGPAAPPAARADGERPTGLVMPPRDPEVARMIAQVAGMRVERQVSWRQRLVVVPIVGAVLLLRDVLGGATWFVVSAIGLAFTLLEARRRWRRSSLDR